jgi:hypothetical protein
MRRWYLPASGNVGKIPRLRSGNTPAQLSRVNQASQLSQLLNLALEG